MGFEVSQTAKERLMYVLLGIMLFLFIVAVMPRDKVNRYAYPLVRFITVQKIDWQTRSMATYETEHFRIRHDGRDAQAPVVIGQAAEEAYVYVGNYFGKVPAGKTPVIIYDDKQEMNNRFGMKDDQYVTGVYGAGIIKVLSPRSFLKKDEPLQVASYYGTMVHEYTHLMLEHVAAGNYTGWFNEGLAQYVEYSATGYEFLSDSSRVTNNLYSLADMDGGFERLEDKDRAYRAAFLSVRYIAEVYGEDKLKLIIHTLAAGRKTEQAIENVLLTDYAQFGAKWQMWLRNTK